MTEFSFNLEKIIERYEHETEAMLIPGILLFFGLLYFYHNLIAFSTPFLPSGVTFVVFFVICYGIGFILHDLGKWLEKLVFEDWWKQNLKSKAKVNKIVSKELTRRLEKVYKLSSISQDEWERIIRGKKEKLNPELKIEIKAYNRHNKLLRGLIIVSLLLMILTYIKDFQYVKVYLPDYIIFTVCMIVAIIFAVFAMRKFEIRENKVVYEHMLSEN